MPIPPAFIFEDVINQHTKRVPPFNCHARENMAVASYTQRCPRSPAMLTPLWHSASGWDNSHFDAENMASPLHCLNPQTVAWYLPQLSARMLGSRLRSTCLHGTSPIESSLLHLSTAPSHGLVRCLVWRMVLVFGFWFWYCWVLELKASPPDTVHYSTSSTPCCHDFPNYMISRETELSNYWVFLPSRSVRKNTGKQLNCHLCSKKRGA